MTEEDLNKNHGSALAEVLGADYRVHPAYPRIVEQAARETRTMTNILADYRERTVPGYKPGW